MSAIQSSEGVLVSAPTPMFSHKSEKGAVVTVEQVKYGILPELRSSAHFDKSKPLPTSLQSDFIPEDILFALTQPPPIKDKLGPVSTARNLNTTSVNSRPSPANVWSHKRRNRFKHLVDNTPCVCGAGKDISFLYDVPQTLSHPVKPDKLDKSAIRKEEIATFGKPLQLPDTLIPDEYHIVKNKGVVGIEFHDDKFSTNPEDHEKHLVVFPSLKPASRYEVMQLKNALNSMLDKVGANDLESDKGSGPTQMHNLLELIKKEQNIYNVVFHELIRQTSVECVERGELLADLRKKYSDLLNKIPLQIMSLHEEVMAQRALDRRLTEELMRFKGTISFLTSELTDVKEHDMKVTQEAQKAQDDLRSALAESQKNSNLLAEYHDLYELQRKRLEGQVFMLSEERELWSTAAYSLALKVTEEYQLNTAKRMQLSEKCWVKMANHFTILLSDRDTDLLTQIQGHVENWRDHIEDFNLALKQKEEDMRDSLKKVKSGIESYWQNFQQKYVDLENGIVKKPDEEFTRALYGALQSWDEIIIKETDIYGGDNLLNTQDQLSRIRKEMEGWTDCALKVFRRHRANDGKTHPDQANMQALNEEVDQLLAQFQHRITGENGVAALIINFQSSLENWETRLLSNIHGVLALQEADWGTFYQTMEDWVSLLKQAVEFVGTTQKDEDRQDGKPHTSPRKSKGFKIIVDIHDVVRKVQKWATTSSNSIDSEDGRMVEMVAKLHSEMVKWMVQILLRLAPDKESNSKEANEMALLGSASIEQLTEGAKTLFESLERFSDNVTLCCNGIVVENTQKRQENNEDNFDHELKDMKRLKTECDDWIQTAQLLLSQLTGEPLGTLFPFKEPTTFITESDVEPSQDRSSSDYKNKVTFVDKEKFSDAQRDVTSVSERSKDEVDVLKPSRAATETAEPNDTADPAETVEPTVAAEPTGIAEPTGTGEQAETAEPLGTAEEEEDSVKVSIPPAHPTTPIQPTTPVEKIEILGSDANTHTLTIKDEKVQALGHAVVKSEVPGSPDTKTAFEALAAVQSLQDQLIAAELRAQTAEERALQAEAAIVALQEKLRSFEKLMGQHEQKLTREETSGSDIQAQSVAANIASTTYSPRASLGGKDEKSGKKSARSSSKGSKKK